MSFLGLILTLTKLRLFFHWRKLSGKCLFLAFCQFVVSKGIVKVRFSPEIAVLMTEC